jgi:hypothetical protein
MFLNSLLLFLILCPAVLFAGKTCYSPADAVAHPNKDVCVKAHVYDIVELTDGTRFLDVCSPETPDEECRFTILSAGEDRKTVGDLDQYREQDIQIRGIVRPFGGRAEILLSNARQFHGGSEKFRPNPALLHGFSAEDGKTAFSDPAMRSGRHRSVFKSGH